MLSRLSLCTMSTSSCIPSSEFSRNWPCSIDMLSSRKRLSLVSFCSRICNFRQWISWSFFYNYCKWSLTCMHISEWLHFKACVTSSCNLSFTDSILTFSDSSYLSCCCKSCWAWLPLILCAESPTKFYLVEVSSLTFSCSVLFTSDSYR